MMDVDENRGREERMRICAVKGNSGTEEEVLFPLLSEKGVPMQGCPVGALTAEHARGRALVKELADAVHTFLTNPRWMVYSLLVGLFLHILNLAGLYILFLAFQQPVQLGTLVSGFGMGVVFYVVTILPQGVGTVLGIMTLVFNSMGIPKANALVITLTFRGLNFWLPVLCGFLLIRSLSRFKSTSG